MKESQFINQNKKKWAKFEKMSKTKTGDPDEMSELFIEITDDLAYARTHYPKRSVRVYLNSMAQRIFHDIFKKKREPLSRFWTFWTTELPLELYRARFALLTAAIIFLVGSIIGIISTYDDPDFLGVIVGQGYVELAEDNIELGKPMNIYGSSPEGSTFTRIAHNNLQVMFFTFILGIFFSLGSAVYLFFNSIMVGAFQWFYVVRNLGLTSFLTIWIHGAFEIPAIIISAAAGITLGNGFLFPGTLTRGQSLIFSAKRGVKIMIGLIPFIITAAFIEGYATRHTVISTNGNPLETEWPDSLKWVFILTCFAIILFYFVIYPFMVARKHPEKLEIKELPQFRTPVQIDFLKIKNLGEIFTDMFSSFRKIFSHYKTFFLTTTLLCFLYLIYLFDVLPFYAYQYEINSYFANIFSLPILRAEKVVENLGVIFSWDSFFRWDLFLFQTVIFSLTAVNTVYLFRVYVRKNLDKGTRSYFVFAYKHIWLTLVGFALIGLIICNVSFPLLFLFIFITPFIFTWFIAPMLGEDKWGRSFKQGWTYAGKHYGIGLGLFFTVFITLFIILVYLSLPLDLIKDQVSEWIIIPLAHDPQYFLIFVDAFLHIIIAQFIFPIFLIGYIMIYYSAREKHEATGLFKELEKFGERNKLYEYHD